MSQDRPTQFPEWASSPPAGPPTDITEPTAPQKASGWQPSGSAEFPDGKPVRQIMNWLQNLFYRWVEWLDQVSYRPSDMSPDQALPVQGSAPSTGAGLGPVAAADFAATVYVDGYRLGPIDSPAHTYSANADTYWDLGRDGEWTFVEVAAMAAAPAVTADSTRVYAVRTDATDRTAVILDERGTHLIVEGNWDFKDNMRLGSDKLASAAEANAERLTTPYKPGNTADEFTQVWALPSGDGSQQSIRFYVHSETETLWMVNGASWNDSTSMWDRDPGVLLATRIKFSNESGLNVFRGLDARILDVSSTPSWANSVWDDVLTAASDLSKMLFTRSGISAGLLDGNSDYEKAMIPCFWGRFDTSQNIRGLYGLGTHSSIYEHNEATSGTDAATQRGWEFGINCIFDEPTAEWQREDAGFDCYKVEMTSDGLRVLLHDQSLAATWLDSIDPLTWTKLGTWKKKTLTRSIPASKAQGGSNAVSATAPVHAHDPVDNTFSPGTLSLISTPDENKHFVIPVELPDGVVVTGASVQMAIALPGSEEARAALIRLNPVTDVRTSFRAAGPFYDLLAATGGAFVDQALTIDAAAAVRTIDNSTYNYYIVITDAPGDQNHTFRLAGATITYEQTEHFT